MRLPYIKLKKPKKSLEEAKYTRWMKNQAKNAAARLTTYYNNSYTKLYTAMKAFMTTIDKKQLDILYHDSGESKNTCNREKEFADFHAKIYKYVMANNNIIRSEHVKIVILFLENYL